MPPDSSRPASLRDAIAARLELPLALEHAAVAMPGWSREVLDRAVRRMRGAYEQDEWGYDEEFVEIVYPLLEFMYENWWRVKATGLNNVPGHDRAMLVANHAGVVPWDATMMAVAIQKLHPLPRQPRFMVLDWAFRLPWVSSFSTSFPISDIRRTLRFKRLKRCAAFFPPQSSTGRTQRQCRARAACAPAPRCPLRTRCC